MRYDAAFRSRRSNVLAIVKQGWREAAPGDSILMSYDPVAHDRVGLQLYTQMLTAEGGDPTKATKQATPCLKNGAALGLGVSDLDRIEWVQVSLRG